ncbi:hypothetical protein ARMSODRAFT_1027662 [Armillaria solidipes]|uniref:Uncharacterized protein n=1 Tax=Armillaria solidipes TaxID=1076256 RepID=A0A2H3AJT9_9AGAR|nr:hypothetical protein ARMSODRAFT_1027662 [Armillaria solidipes]
MVNPGAFKGSRREFLMQEVEGYIKAVEEGRAAEFIADVVRRYLKRYPLSLEHNVEPSQEHLAAVDDHAPDPEVVMPNEDELTFEEYEKVQLKFIEDQKDLKFRSEQIRRWLRYQYAKRNDMSAKDMGADNPWTVLLHRLTGVGLSKPRKPQAFALWYKANATEVEAAWKAHMEVMKTKGSPIAPGQRAAGFQSFKSKMYRDLPAAEKKSWEGLAAEEHEVAIKEYEEKLHAPVSQEAKDYQSCLERLPSVVKPLIDIIVEATGCPVSIYVGGPQPADGGRLHIASFHGGKTLGVVKQNFVEAERANLKRYILPVYSNFLKRCFSVEMCRARALPSSTPTLDSIGFASEEDGVTLHTIDGEVYNNAGGKELVSTLPPATTTPAPTTASTTATTATATTTKVKKTITKTTKAAREAPVKKSSEVRLEKPATDASQPAAPSSDLAKVSNPAAPSNSPTPSPPTDPPQLPSPSSQADLEPNAPPLPSMVPAGPAEGSNPTAPSPPTDPPQPAGPTEASLGSPSSPPPLSPPLSPAVSRAGSPQSSRIPSRPATPDEGLDAARFVTPKDASDAEAEDPEPTRSVNTGTASKPTKQPKNTGDGEQQQGGRTRRTNAPTTKTSSAPKGGKRGAEHGGDEEAGVSSSPRARKKRKVTGDRTVTPEHAASSASAESSPQLVLPDDAPKWAISAVNLFKREDVPVCLLQLCEKWIEFETRESNWAHSGKLSAVDRPKPIGDWINRARTERFRLQAPKSGVDPVRDFEAKFWLWWSQLQPEFRQRDESEVTLALDHEGHADRKSEGDWGMLRLPGMNGWVSVMAALCFWAWLLKGMSENGHREKAAAARARENWLSALEDVDFVLGRLL